MTNLQTHPSFVAGTWKIDPTHSEISFWVKHLMISKVRGTFTSFEGAITTGGNASDLSVTAKIEVASVDTNQKDRDAHLRTSDFFLAEEFPTMDFTSTAIESAGDAFTLTGDLTLRGVTKQVVLTGEFGGVVTDGYGQTKAGATATTTINRHDFGVSWNAALEAGGATLGDTVTINVDVQVVLEP